MRVAEAAAGANWGGNFIPRIGQEVQVDFIAGDIDRPVVTGQVYNGADTPPFHGADNHPGALAGFKSKEYAGGGFSQWVMDDTPGQLRQTLASSYAGSQLNIGYLIRQNGNVRGSFRGTGLELASDAWSVLRAKRGLFVTTAQRAQAVSTQLDSEEAKGKLKAGKELAKALSDASVQHQALGLSTAEGLQKLSETLEGKEAADGNEAPAFAVPVGLIDSAAGINVATPASSLTFAGQDLSQTTHLAMRVTAGQAVSMVSGKTTSLFTHAGGAKVIAGNSPVSVRAHTGPMDVLADQAMTITSSNASIRIQAKQEILLTSGGGYIRLKGGNIDIHCPVSVSVKGASHDFKGGGSIDVSLPFVANPGHAHHDNVPESGRQSSMKKLRNRLFTKWSTWPIPIADIPFHVQNIAEKTQRLVSERRSTVKSNESIRIAHSHCNTHCATPHSTSKPEYQI